MINKSLLSFMFGSGLILASQPAMALKINYEHKYEDISKEHTNELEVSHDFDSGVGIGAKFKFHPEEKNNSDAGDFFEHREIDEKEFKINYTYGLNSKISIEPGMTFDVKKNEEEYKPSFKVKYHPFNDTKISLRYRKEISDRDEKPTKRVDRVDMDVSQKFKKIVLSYELTWYNGNESLYNKKHQNIEQEVDIGYQLTRHFLPYIGIENEAVSKNSSARQTEFITGITYEF